MKFIIKIWKLEVNFSSLVKFPVSHSVSICIYSYRYSQMSDVSISHIDIRYFGCRIHTDFLWLQVESDDKYERIGGTSMGGGTFWGLGSLLTKAKGFDELLHLASEGDHRNVDLLVKDIYGKISFRNHLPFCLWEWIDMIFVCCHCNVGITVRPC